jgi:hypothetical protein
MPTILTTLFERWKETAGSENPPPDDADHTTSSPLAFPRVQCISSLPLQEMSVRTLIYIPTYYFLALT